MCTPHTSVDGQQRTYMAIDLKSFYASVECMERKLNPLTTHLVVADASRTEKTICLAVTPSLKKLGIGGRPRLFEVVQQVRLLNNTRLYNTSKHQFTGKSYLEEELTEHPDWEIDYLVVPPRMALYVHYSNIVYQTYLRFIAPEDIHVYSVDEVFMDITEYLRIYKTTAHELAMKIIREVLNQTGITATVGIGTNLYLCKVAMDIVAKHIPADKDGVRIANLDEMTYRKTLWNHRPLTSFWRVGKGIARTLEKYHIYTMGQIARLSIDREEFFYKLFGVNAELLIDHAWGWEPCTMKDIKNYRAESHSVSNGQILSRPYTYTEAYTIVKEMADSMSMRLLANRMQTNQIVLDIGYDSCSTKTALEQNIKSNLDHYGRQIPKHGHGSISVGKWTSSTTVLVNAAGKLYERICNRDFYIRKVTITAANIRMESNLAQCAMPQQLDLFLDNDACTETVSEKKKQEKERRTQEAILRIRERFGKNAILKGSNLRKESTARERNGQLGGHKA